MVADQVSELVDTLELGSAERVYAEMARTLAKRLDGAQRASAAAAASKELRVLLGILTAGRGAADALLAELFGDGDDG